MSDHSHHAKSAVVSPHKLGDEPIAQLPLALARLAIHENVGVGHREKEPTKRDEERQTGSERPAPRHIKLSHDWCIHKEGSRFCWLVVYPDVVDENDYYNLYRD